VGEFVWIKEREKTSGKGEHEEVVTSTEDAIYEPF
jgi:hypothetical protein